MQLLPNSCIVHMEGQINTSSAKAFTHFIKIKVRYFTQNKMQNMFKQDALPTSNLLVREDQFHSGYKYYHLLPWYQCIDHLLYEDNAWHEDPHYLNPRKINKVYILYISSVLKIKGAKNMRVFQYY